MWLIPASERPGPFKLIYFRNIEVICFQSKRDAYEKQFCNDNLPDNLPSRRFPSTMSLIESWRVCLADLTIWPPYLPILTNDPSTSWLKLLLLSGKSLSSHHLFIAQQCIFYASPLLTSGAAPFCSEFKRALCLSSRKHRCRHCSFDPSLKLMSRSDRGHRCNHMPSHWLCRGSIVHVC